MYTLWLALEKRDPYISGRLFIAFFPIIMILILAQWITLIATESFKLVFNKITNQK